MGTSKYGRIMAAAAFATALAAAPQLHAANWHRGGYHYHGGHGNAAGAAIIGGIIGLGVGAAIASNSYNRYYAPPPPVYYGYPNSAYYAPPPPVYYGYGY
ncbi:MAG TPA: hypothetical protein VMF05_09315 [Stellaceae bacterium]|nr:hypothetical protein [Stellaceae bacterium]